MVFEVPFKGPKVSFFLFDGPPHIICHYYFNVLCTLGVMVQGETNVG